MIVPGMFIKPDADSFFALYGLEKYEYTAGITYSVRIPANTNPPTTTIPRDVRLPEEVPSDNAMGNVPKIMARVVIRMGLNRDAAAVKTASRTFIPSAFRWLANSTIRIPFFVIKPMSMIMPISLNTLID